MGEKTLYIIKPEAFNERGRIRKIIQEKNNLSIDKYRIKKLTKKEVSLMIDCDHGFKSNKKLFEAALYFMTRGLVEIGIIKGENCVNIFKELCGNKKDPKRCEENTIRNIFGISEIMNYKGGGYYLNAIHRSDTIEEAEKEIQLFFKTEKT